MSASLHDSAALVREADRDRYLAALLVGEPMRRHLLALYAFDVELAGIGQRVTEPLAGEIRLQWWRDQLAAMQHGAPGDHPVLKELQPAIASARLPMDALLAMIDARVFDIHPEPMPDMHTLDGYLGETFSIPMQLACLILADGQPSDTGGVAGHAGMAAGIAWLLRNLPRHVSRGRIYVPEELLARHGQDIDALLRGEGGAGLKAAIGELRGHARAHLAEARARLAGLPARFRPAFAPLAMVEPVLRRTEKASYRPLTDLIGFSPFRRQWRVWRAMRAGF